MGRSKSAEHSELGSVLDLGDAARSMNPRPRSCLSTPLLIGKNLAGGPTLYSTAPNAFTEEHQRLLEVVARQVAASLMRASDIDLASAPAAPDQLTGLPTAESLRQLLDAQAPRPTSVLVIHVRSVGSKRRVTGPAVDDDVVSAVATAARRSLRPVDLLFRGAGGQLVALMLKTDRATAVSVSAAIQEAVSTESAQAQAKLPPEITIIVTSVPEDGSTLAEVIDLAILQLPRDVSRQNSTSSMPPPRSIH